MPMLSITPLVRRMSPPADKKLPLIPFLRREQPGIPDPSQEREQIPKKGNALWKECSYVWPFPLGRRQQERPAPISILLFHPPLKGGEKGGMREQLANCEQPPLIVNFFMIPPTPPVVSMPFIMPNRSRAS